MSDQAVSEWMARVPGLDRLWSLTHGRADIRIAILDGPEITGPTPPSHVERHGAHVRSIVAGSQDGVVPGLCPDCTTFSIPIFDAGAAAICTQQRLAESIHEALAQNADIINISAAQQSDLLSLSAELAQALQAAQQRDVLVVAAAGNHGCACDTIPAAIAGVLAVGAHDLGGVPLLSSNWGLAHRAQGVLAPGLDIPGACVDGSLCRASGTSFAAAIVSGIAGLLMSAEADRGHRPGGSRIRQLLLASADPAPEETELASPYLSGRLNLSAALDRLLASQPSINHGEGTLTAAAIRKDHDFAPPPPADAARVIMPAEEGLVPADCGCGCGGEKNKDGSCGCGGHDKKPQLVYAIGRLGVSFISQARRDSIWRMVNGSVDGDLKPISDKSLVDLFKKNPFQSSAVV